MSDIIIDTQVLRSLREARGWDQHTLASSALETPVDTLLVERYRHAPAAFVAELTAAVNALAGLSTAHQRQVAAILRGYLSALPE